MVQNLDPENFHPKFGGSIKKKNKVGKACRFLHSQRKRLLTKAKSAVSKTDVNTMRSSYDSIPNESCEVSFDTPTKSRDNKHQSTKRLFSAILVVVFLLGCFAFITSSPDNVENLMSQFKIDNIKKYLSSSDSYTSTWENLTVYNSSEDIYTGGSESDIISNIISVSTPTPIGTPVSSPMGFSPTASMPTLIVKPVGSPGVSPVSSPAVKPVGSPAAKPVGSPGVKPVGSPAAVPIASPGVKPVGAPNGFPVSSPASVPVTSPVASPSSNATIDSSALDSSYFQIQRLGYRALAYFSEKSTKTAVNYPFLEAYDSIVEPYVNSSLIFMGDGNDAYFNYVVEHNSETVYTGSFSSGTSRLVEANVFAVKCVPYDNVTITISVSYTDKVPVPSESAIKVNSICMYVRREVRDLPETDLIGTVAAMSEIWSRTEIAGRELYGEDFHSSSWFTSMHDFNAGWRDADHIHEGLGFIPQHIKMTNYFEKAMQAVDPSISLFYWDFTIDDAEDTPLSDSIMFQTKTFGQLREPADSYWGWTYRNDSILDAGIQTGRWQNTKSQPLQDRTDLLSGFGYMRAPWNMNPSPLLSRFYSYSASSFLPSCLSYYKWLEMDDFEDFFQEAENSPHAATHGAIGGYFGCDMLDELRLQGLISDSDSQLKICAKWGFYMKEMYRGNFISPETSCKVDDELSFEGVECSYLCRENMAADHITMMKTSINLKDYLPEDIDDDGWSTWRDFICYGNGYRIFVGDHLESASTADPSFWPIHPTIERLLQLKYMVGGFNNFTWPTEATRDGDYVCNHAICYQYDDLSLSKNFYDGCCYGHFEFDQLLDWTTWNRSSTFGPTNYDVLVALNPRSGAYSMPYIYEDFNWDHCEEDFDGLIDRLAISAGL